MLSLDPKDLKTSLLHQYLLHAIAPRPIAFASTIDKDGNPNLSPFSFFNVFSANPPVVIFSPARSGRTGATKNTHDNIREVPEVVINIVNYDLVQQASLTSTEYPKGVNEFVKAGLTQEPSVKIRPFRVKESPVQLECLVKDVVELGQHGGAGNLIIAEIVMMHIKEEILDPETKMIDQQKIDLVARMGADWYCRASGNALFKVAKPLTTIGIGVDQLPAAIRNSKVLTGTHLGQLGNIEKLPTPEEVEKYKASGAILEAWQDYGNDAEKLETHLHQIAARLLGEGRVEEAWKVLLIK
ncbi:MAG TPA: flavin reductase family protein [Bacteroidia bacterium]|nr:flavin reductase family protein [Bacteroidia bacterium]